MSSTLPYWIESQINGSSADVWVPLPANCTRVVCEWGSPGQTTSLSNGYLVFPNLFDDFSNDSINTTTWDGSLSGVSISSGICTVTGIAIDHQLQSRPYSSPRKHNY